MLNITKLQSWKKMRVQNNKKKKVSDMEIKCADCGCLPSGCKATKSPTECPDMLYESPTNPVKLLL